MANHHDTVTFPRLTFFQIVSYNTDRRRVEATNPPGLTHLNYLHNKDPIFRQFDRGVVPARPASHVEHDLNDNKMNPIHEHVEGK